MNKAIVVDGKLTDESVNDIFTEVALQVLKYDEIAELLTVDQKRQILDALEVKVETPEEDIVIVHVLFVTVKIDASDIADLKMEISYDVSRYLK